MSRSARLVIPGMPHHITQRGNRQQTIFFSDEDRRAYIQMLAASCTKHATQCLAWCLMDNHVHLVLVPTTEDGLRATLAGVHTLYAQRINLAQGLSGHVFQGRFHSYAMDEGHCMIAVRYVENNPVTARMVKRAEDWQWSSARAHIDGAADGLTDIAALGQHIPNWRAMLADGLEASDRIDAVEGALLTGRPIGAASWLSEVASQTGKLIVARRRGRPARKPEKAAD